MSGAAHVKRTPPIPDVPANYHLRKLHVLITSRCNFTCVMCSIIHEDKNALSEQQVRGLIEEADRLGFDEMEISGGEPYYLPYFRTVLEDYAGNTQVNLKVCTNAFHLDDALVRTLAGRRRLHFQVSFDGTREVHNAIRVQNRYDAFPQSDRNLRSLAAAGIATSLNTVIQRHNVGNILETYRYFRDVPYLFHGFGIVEDGSWNFAENDFRPEQLQPLADELEQLLHEAKRDRKNVGIDHEMIDHIRNRGGEEGHRDPGFPLHAGYGCTVPWSIVIVDEHGNVYPCFHTNWGDRSQFSIRDRTLSEVLFSPEYIERSRARVAIDGCSGCTTACYFHDPVFRRKCLNPTPYDLALRDAQRAFLRKRRRAARLAQSLGVKEPLRKLRGRISRFVRT
jgi:MoaA/NifB/PqqE/SkfB family radical SAM enzyme